MLLNRKAFAISCGFIWAFIIFFIGLAGAFGLVSNIVHFISEFYIGFDATFIGSIIGMIWAFIEAFVLGFVFAWMYNYFAQKEEEL